MSLDADYGVDEVQGHVDFACLEKISHAEINELLFHN